MLQALVRKAMAMPRTRIGHGVGRVSSAYTRAIVEVWWFMPVTMEVAWTGDETLETTDPIFWRAGHCLRLAWNHENRIWRMWVGRQ
jgi:hypothetical protein